GLLIRRSLVRAQVGEPNFKSLNNRLGFFFFSTTKLSHYFLNKIFSLCEPEPLGKRKVFLGLRSTFQLSGHIWSYPGGFEFTVLKIAS
ncbi:MAG: hypothetical protein Q4A84_08735, partial [Neisseria sp.]|uniref:hypothetical protein n=1 Tax=Neisseria sp. TaxID=192066 RepID=UPI0026DBFAC9